MGNTCKIGLAQIDTIATSPGIIECIEGYTLLEIDEIVLSDYR